MKKIQNKNTKIIAVRKECETKKSYIISVAQKGTGFQARITLKIAGGGKNPRISTYSSISKKDAVYKILRKIIEKLNEYKNMNLLEKEICLNIYDSIVDSIKELKLTTDSNIMNLTTNIFQILTISDNTKPNTNNLCQNKTMYIEDFFQNQLLNLNKQNQEYLNKLKDFESVANEWFEYKKSLTKQSADNPKPLSPKTIAGYNPILKNIIIPYFKNNKDINLITEKSLKNLINLANGYRVKETVYIVLKMLFDFAKEKNYIQFVPKIKKPQKPYTDGEEEIIFIESDRQNLWIDYFEQENTDISLLFETMLLTGIRPEEACGLKWSALDEKNNELIINNAYKDYPIYNGIKIIGHKRSDGRLKTPESYRKIPLNPRLKLRLSEHKEKQKELLKLYNINWNVNYYMFLNRYMEPYIPENLSKPMRNFITKYDLEHMTPYGLRHSFATFCSEQGMDEIVLMRLMGHSNFDTTQKYYICISSTRKRKAIQKVYKNIFNKENEEENFA